MHQEAKELLVCVYILPLTLQLLISYNLNTIDEIAIHYSSAVIQSLSM